MTTLPEGASARSQFRVLTRRRGAYDAGQLIDVQLQDASTGGLIWARTFSDPAQAEGFQAEVEEDLETFDADAFRTKYGVPGPS